MDLALLKQNAEKFFQRPWRVKWESRKVSLVYLAYLVWLVELDSPNEQNKPDEPDQPSRLTRHASWSIIHRYEPC